MTPERKDQMDAMRRLVETGAFLTVGTELKQAGVFRKTAGALRVTRMVPLETAAELLGQGHIKLAYHTNKIRKFVITQDGRQALTLLLKEQRNER